MFFFSGTEWHSMVSQFNAVSVINLIAKTIDKDLNWHDRHLTSLIEVCSVCIYMFVFGLIVDATFFFFFFFFFWQAIQKIANNRASKKNGDVAIDVAREFWDSFAYYVCDDTQHAPLAPPVAPAPLLQPYFANWCTKSPTPKLRNLQKLLQIRETLVKMDVVVNVLIPHLNCFLVVAL
jgi:uncharacterized membrane protein